LSDIELIRLLRRDFKEEELPIQLEIMNLLIDHYKETNLVMLWLKTKNPVLRNRTPMEMIRAGEGKKLLKFIQASLEENKRD
jgi:hypothetical protein